MWLVPHVFVLGSIEAQVTLQYVGEPKAQVELIFVAREDQPCCSFAIYITAVAGV